MASNGALSRSSARIGVTSSPDIAFPAPAPSLGLEALLTPGSGSSRSKRSAAQAAAASISKSAASSNKVAARDYAQDGSVSPSSSAMEEQEDDDEDGAPSLTNGDTMDDDYDDTSSMLGQGGMGETDEYTMDEMEYSHDAKYKDELTDEDELLAPAPQVKASKRKASTSSPAKRRSKNAKTTDESMQADTTEDDTAAIASSSKPKRKAPARATKAVKAMSNGDDATAEGSDSSALTDIDAKAGEEETTNNDDDKPAKKPRKARKPRAPKPEPVYVIPEVEKLPNLGYQGRLGYACLNTILRNRKPPVFCSRTCRIDTIKKNGMDFLKELGRQNIMDCQQLIQWNEDNNIRFMRLSSEMFPFASHGEYGYTLEYAEKELKEAGDLANKYGHRITTHPGQFTQLGSPRHIVVTNAIKDLTYHCEMLDRMGIGKEGVMIIHGGGVFGDKPGTIERLKKNYIELVPENVKGRLVLENDEMGYNVDDLLPICEELNIPMVLDYHHHNLFPTAEKTLEELMPRILATWERKGIKPKFHLSEPRLGAVSLMERRAHSDRCKLLPTPLPPHVDLMIEAKDKEQAVFQLHRIYDLQPTVHENLRPPVDVESLRTQGRKSSKKKKVKAEDAEEEDEEGVEAPDPDDAMVDIDGAQVLPPVEDVGDITKKAKKTPAKKGRKKAEVKTEDSSTVLQTPGAGEVGDTEATPAKPKRKPSVKKAVKAAADALSAAVKSEQEDSTTITATADLSNNQAIIDQVLAEPSEAAPVEDMDTKDIPDHILQAQKEQQL